MLAAIKAVVPLATLLRYAAIAAAALGAYAYWHHQVYEAGRDYERGLIAAKDKGAIDRAENKITEYDRCVAAYGRDAWNRAAGRCNRA